MVCPKCRNEFSDDMSFCPNCGAAAARPVIPDTAPVTYAAPVISRAPVHNTPQSTVQSAPAAAPQGSEYEERADDSVWKKAAAALAVIAVILAAAVVLLVIDRGRLQTELDDGEKSSRAADSRSSGLDSKESELSVKEANYMAKEVFAAASESVKFLSQADCVIGYGVVCSSYDVGQTTSKVVGLDFSNDELTKLINDLLADKDEELSGIEWFVFFDGGEPIAAYAAQNGDTRIIGSYPRAAAARCLLSFRSAKGTVTLEHAASGKSANDLFGNEEEE